ncbi:hypothetical protein SETIT_2G004700v2 [Setaria italica]|uniref:Uncharacterized protein n=1 Tax=Setaria italica TaxID=4555 RepID=A0A368PTN8_SETIT|nr:hypothetical protein SETIT_2G004700v2 [Setaria italica]
MIRRFVNIVAENYKSGMYSLHRLDVSKHLFYPCINGRSTSASGGTRSTGENWFPHEHLAQPLNHRQAFFGLVSPRSGEGKVLFINKDGHTLHYDADSYCASPLPSLQHPEGSSPVSASVARTESKGKKTSTSCIQRDSIQREGLYVIHSTPAGLDSESCFNVLRFGSPDMYTSSFLHRWYWQPLPLPPFVFSPQYKPSLISSYTVVEGGRTICLSLATEGIGTYCFDTVNLEWRHAGDWMMLPFDGKAEYSPELKLWLGFSLGTTCVRHRASLPWSTNYRFCIMSGKITLPRSVWQRMKFCTFK